MFKYPKKFYKDMMTPKNYFELLKYTKFKATWGFIIYDLGLIMNNGEKKWLAKYIISNLDIDDFIYPHTIYVHQSMLNLLLSTNDNSLIKWFIKKKHNIDCNLTKFYIIKPFNDNLKVLKLLFNHDIWYDNVIICQMIFDACCRDQKNIVKLLIKYCVKLSDGIIDKVNGYVPAIRKMINIKIKQEKKYKHS